MTEPTRRRHRSCPAAIGVLVAFLPAMLCHCAVRAAQPPAPVEIAYKVIAAYPHDPEAFTQGLVYAGGALYESTGLYGRSSLRRVDLESGTPLIIRPLAKRYFAEGLTAMGERLIQLTWRGRTGFVYSRDDLRLMAEFQYTGDGWGLTHDGEHLIMSDGSATLRFLHAQSFVQVRSLEVRDDQGPVTLLNELEYVGGDLYANVWRSPRILRIDPVSGWVTGFVDLSALVAQMDGEPSTDVLNGIAYIPGSGRLLVTGKNWPKLFAIVLE